MRYAVIEAGQVVAVVEWDGSSRFAGTLVRSDTAGIGDSYSGGAFTPAPTPERIKGELELLVDTLVSKGILAENERPGRPAQAGAGATRALRQ